LQFPVFRSPDHQISISVISVIRGKVWGFMAQTWRISNNKKQPTGCRWQKSLVTFVRPNE